MPSDLRVMVHDGFAEKAILVPEDIFHEVELSTENGIQVGISTDSAIHCSREFIELLNRWITSMN